MGTTVSRDEANGDAFSFCSPKSEKPPEQVRAERLNRQICCFYKEAPSKPSPSAYSNQNDLPMFTGA